MKFNRALARWVALGLGARLVLGPAAFGFEKPNHDPLPNFDKREAVEPAPAQLPVARAAAELKAQVPGVQIDMDEVLGTPKHVASPRGFLSGPKGVGKGISARTAQAFAPDDSSRAVKSFLREHAAMFGHGPEVLDRARLRRHAVTPHNGLETFVWEQQVDEIPVFEGLLVSHVTAAGELVSVSSRCLADPEAAANVGLPNRKAAQGSPKISAREAVARAAVNVGEALGPGETAVSGGEPAGKVKRQKFKAARFPGETQASLVWLPVNSGELRLCWQIQLKRRKGGESFLVLVDARTGEVWLRRGLTVYYRDASFRVYDRDSPSPFTPGHSEPSTNQPPLVPRVLKTWPALSTVASPTGWITEAENETRGNNVDAHLDRNGDDLPDLPRPRGVPFRVFDFPLDLNADPYTYGDASTVNLFYWCNWMHDQLYELGFTEAAGNFQKDNFGRGGEGNDPVLADAQDGSGFNNANYTQAPEGTSPRIQMYLFDGPQPYRDGDLDAEIILHEYAHGLSDRLIGGGVGIYQLQTLGMGEGWSDFYALSLLSEPGDDVDGVYPSGGYATWQYRRLDQNYYFGIRRYPYTTDLSKNPLTFKDIDPAQAIPHTGVPMSPIRFFDPTRADEVHSQGEVWCVTLWEVRARLIKKHGYEIGQRLTMRLVTDGLKLSPPNPTFLQARDAILQADQVNTGGRNQAELWAGFAKRGLGTQATSPPTWTTAGLRESFDLPDPLVIAPRGSLAFSTPVGGPVVGSCRSFLLSNTSGSDLLWASGHNDSWFDLSPSGGVLAAGGAAEVKACLKPEVGELPLGGYFQTILFSNLTSGVTHQRGIQLSVVNFAGMPFEEHFESERLASYWAVTGTGTARSQVTTNLEPRAGTGHLVLDSEVSGNYSRNEVTLGIDLAGWTNVVLRFWAKQFRDEPDGPPSIPFVDGADFDGVAVSADGVRWYEVQGLRALSERYTEWVVDLDAAVARFGLSYNSSFRIRFNHYDNQSAPDDGVALDDLSIAGVAPRRFSLAIPAEAREGAGVLRGAGRVTLPVPPVSDLQVTLSSSDPLRVFVPETVIIRAGRTSAVFDITIPDNAVLEGSQSVSIAVSAPGHIGAREFMVVRDNETAAITLVLPDTVREGDGLLGGAGRVVLDAVPARDLSVDLISASALDIQVPPKVIIPAGQASVLFDLRVGDNSRIELTRLVLISAAAEGVTGATNAVRVLDNESSSLAVTGPDLVGEGSGPLVGSAVRIAGSLPTNLVVALTSSDPARISVPAAVVLFADQTRAGFNLLVLSDGILDEDQPVVITARAPGFQEGRLSIRALDDEVPPGAFAPEPAHLSTNNALEVSLSWSLGRDEIVLNGGFETGDWSGWHREDTEGGGTVINDGTVIPYGGDEALPPWEGGFGALFQQSAPGRHVLYQDVTIPPQVGTVVLNWTDRIRNFAGDFGSNQSFRVEIRDPQNNFILRAFSTEPGDPPLSGWKERSFSLDALRGRTVRIYFVEEDSIGHLNVHLDNVRIMLGFAGETTSEVYFGDHPLLSAADLLGVTTEQSWLSPALDLAATYYWQVVAVRGPMRSPGPVWRFTTRGRGQLDHFSWSPLGSNQMVQTSFPVAITARDDLENTVTNFSGRVLLEGTDEAVGERVQILAYLPLPGYGLHYRHTLAAIAASFTNFSAAVTATSDVDTLRELLSSRDIFLIPSQDFSTSQELEALGRAWAPLLLDFVQHGGVVVVCSFVSQEHLILDTSGLLSLTKLGRFRTANLVKRATHPLAEGVPASFVGHFGAQYSTTNGDTILETTQGNAVAVSRDIGAGRVVMIGTDYTTNRTGLDRVMANVARVVEGRSLKEVALKPRVSGYFLNGVWQGNLTAQDVGPQVVLRADDASGHVGTSGPLAVLARDDLAVSVCDSEDPVGVGSTIVYRIAVTNSGPSAVSAVMLTNRLAPGVTLVGVTNGFGACELTNHSLICPLGPLAGGSGVRVDLAVMPVKGGKTTNTVTVGGSPGEVFLANNTAVAVTRVEVPSIYVSNALVQEGNEGQQALVFQLRLEPASPQTVSCTFATADVLAKAGFDYVASSGTVVFPPGVTNQTLTVQVLGDTYNEINESFALDLSHALNAAIAIPRAYGVILDDDPTPSLSISQETVVEGGEGAATELVFQVGLSAASGQDVTVAYATSNGSALAGLDYIATSGTLAFPPGTTNQTVSVVVRGDLVSEETEQFFLDLTSPVGATLAGARGQGTILDDDAGVVDHFDWEIVPSPQYLNTPFPVALTAKDGLGNTVSGFTGRVTLSGLNERKEITVAEGTNSWNYPMGAYFHDQRVQSIYLAHEIGPAAKITALSLYVTSLPGQSLSNWTIRLKHTLLSSYATGAWEGDGWSIVYQKDEVISATGWVTFPLVRPFEFNGADNLMVDVSFNNASYSFDGRCGFSPVSEARSLFFQTDSGFGDPLTWAGSQAPPPETIERVLSVRFGVEIPIAVATAETGDFVQGQWSGQVIVQEMAAGMALRADDGRGHVGVGNTFLVTAHDDLSVAVPDVFRLSKVGDRLVYRVAVTNTGPTAATGVALIGTWPASVAVLSAAPSQGACQVVEGVLGCELGTLAGASGAGVEVTLRPGAVGLMTNLFEVTRNEVDAFLRNNTATAVALVTSPSLSVEDTSVVEGTGGITNATFVVRLSSPLAEEVTVQYATVAKTASNGVDFASSSGLLVFSPGSTVQEISVVVFGDALDEIDETFLVKLSNPTNAVLDRAQATGLILDDDPVVACTIADASVAEGNAGMTNLQFRVRLSFPSGQVVFVSYATSNDTALTGIDYQSVSGNLAFPPGITNRTINVPVPGDRVIEPDKRFFVNLFKPVNATVARARAVGTILNDDGLDGVLDHFAWGPIATPQVTNQPFAVAIMAKDYAEATVTNFSGTVALSGRVGEADVTVGGRSASWRYPFGTGYHDARTQLIYPTNELGGARRILGLALDMVLPPGQLLNRWTIRMKHTPLASYTDSGWEQDGWQTVYQGNEAVTQEDGWVNFLFKTPFEYNGVNNLMIDFSFNNSYFTSDGLCLATNVPQNRALTFQADSQFGDPLAWSGTTAPVPEAVAYVPHLQLLSGFSVPVMPAAAGRFSKGVWVGPVVVPTAVVDLRLRAEDNGSHVGLSGLFSVLSIPDSDGDGLPDDWEQFYFGSLNSPHGGPQDDPDGDGLTNLEEYMAGTSPLDPESVLRIMSVQWVGGDSIRLGFRSVLGKKYRVERTDALGVSQWTALQDQISGTGGVVEVTDPAAAPHRSRFYRVKLLP